MGRAAIIAAAMSTMITGRIIALQQGQILTQEHAHLGEAVSIHILSHDNLFALKNFGDRH